MTEPPPPQLDPRKFQDPFVTAKGEKRAQVALNRSRRCGSTPDPVQSDLPPLLHRILAKNDRLAYLTAAEVAGTSTRSTRGGFAHIADRLHRRRAVHEPRADRDAR